MKQSFTNNIYEAGLDEAGRGPMIGRVYAGVCIWPQDKECPLINDSKKLTPKKRKEALEWIKKNVEHWAYGYAEPSEIDSINILEATKLAMTRAINNLKVKPTNLIIDGTGWEKKFTDHQVKSVVKGDATYYSIAAASIIAKEYHDEYIMNLCKDNPELNERYDLENNMGYGTVKHMEGIKKFGPSNLHRLTFKGCK